MAARRILLAASMSENFMCRSNLAYIYIYVLCVSVCATRVRS